MTTAKRIAAAILIALGLAAAGTAVASSGVTGNSAAAPAYLYHG